LGGGFQTRQQLAATAATGGAPDDDKSPVVTSFQAAVGAAAANETFATALLAEAFSLKGLASLPSLSHAVQAVRAHFRVKGWG
jgi:hypothetical protein